LIRATSDFETRPDLAILRFRFADLHSSKWRRPAFVRKTLPVPVILNRLATAFLVLLFAIAFGMGPGRLIVRAGYAIGKFADSTQREMLSKLFSLAQADFPADDPV